MANFIEAQSSIVVQFTADTNFSVTPISLACNRSYNLVDYSVNVVTGGGVGVGGADQSRIDIGEYTAAGVLVTALGTVPTDNANAGTWVRPTTVTIAASPALANAALIGAAVVARGNTLRLTTTAAGASNAALVRALGTIRVLPGNRYAAATPVTSYYANNAASGAQGSSATQSI